MRKSVSASVVAACVLAWFGFAGCGETAPPTGAAQSAGAGVESAQPDPNDLLRRMSKYIAELTEFSCEVTSTIDITGRGVDNRMETKLDVRVDRPNRLSLMVAQGMMGVTVVSDGKQLIQYMPLLNRYVSKDAPEDLSGFAEVTSKLGIPSLGGSTGLIPTDGEQFYEAITEGVRDSKYLGSETIDGVACHRCRFVRADMHWDIWIEAGDRPVVRKLVPDLSKQFGQASGALQDAKLDWTVLFSNWDVSPEFTDADFAFTPPADAEQVESLFAGQDEAAPHPLVGQPAPPFQTVDLEGQPIDLQQHVGKEMILLDFWATWCAPCVRAMPDVDAVAEKYADRGLVFYAVNVGEDAAAAKEFLAESKLDVPVAMDPDGAIAGSYQVDGIPQTVLVGKDGRVQVVHVGFSSALGEMLTQNIEDLLAGKDLASEALAEGAEDKASP